MKDAPGPAPDKGKVKVEDFKVPAFFDWKTTSPVVCDISAPHASRVLVSLEPAGEPFAVFVAGGEVAPVSLDVPRSITTLYMRSETATGLTPVQSVSLANGTAKYAVPATAKELTELEDGDKNSTEGNVVYMPARRNGWGTLLFEDMWPAYGDYDFNDLVANYKIQLMLDGANKVEGMLLAVRVKAIGGSLPYGLHVRLLDVPGGQIDGIDPYPDGCRNVSEDAELVVLNAEKNAQEPALLAFRNVRPVHKPEGGKYFNTEENYEVADADLPEAAFAVYFREPLPLSDLSFDGFDFYMANAEGKEIHMGDYPPTTGGRAIYDQLQEGNLNIGKATKFYYSNDNLVWGLNIPLDIAHAYENGDFLEAYPEFRDWVESGGLVSQSWYERGVADKLVRNR